MQVTKTLKDKRLQFETFLIILTILLFLFRTILPFLLIPFILSYSLLVIYSLFTYKKQLKPLLIDYINNYLLLITLLVIILISFLFSNKIYLIILKDTLNSIVLFSLFYFATLFISGKKDLRVFVNMFMYVMLFFAILVTVNGLGKLLYIFKDYVDPNQIGNPEIISNSYFKLDSSFGLLPVIFGLICCFYLLFYRDSIVEKVILNLLIQFFSVFIFFSGSRRGFVILVGIIIILISTQVLRFVTKNVKIKRLSSISIIFFISLFSVGCIIFYSTYRSKDRVLKLVGSQNPSLAKENITFILQKYANTFGNKRTHLDVFNEFWNVVPADPESGWGTMIHKTIFPLTGKNVEIVPTNSKGYLLDNTTRSNSWNGNSYSYTLIGHKNVDDNNIVKASVYCFVSDDFNGDWVRLSSEDAADGEVAKYYNLNSKGTWQKLELAHKCTKGNVRIFLYFAKFGVNDFTSLKGNVIFAYPQVEVINRKDSIIGFLDTYVDTLQKFQLLKNDNILLVNQLIPVFSKQIYKNIVPALLNKDIFEKDKIQICYYSLKQNKNIPVYSLALIDFFSIKWFNNANLTNIKNSLQHWATHLISEDTIYHRYKNNLLADTISAQFIGPRLIRWKFALEIFTKEYNYKQKLIGGGFNHLNWYGYYFLKDKTKSDWPHNPVLSVLLYSGILGLSLYLFFLYKVFYLYFKYAKEYPLLFIFFIITFFFSFFSGGSPFDPPIMGFFVILPFFINSVHKKDSIQLKN
jgi:hypothetical protein